MAVSGRWWLVVCLLVMGGWWWAVGSGQRFVIGGDWISGCGWCLMGDGWVVAGCDC